MEAGGADGISVDFEGLADGTRDHFTTFIRELRAELDARGLATAEISIAGPAVDWGGEFDIPALLDVIDSYFIMGYDLFWSGSSHAGPTGLLRVTADWQPITSLSMLRSIAYYTSQGPAHLRRKIVYGVPYYGREWTTTSSAMGAATIANQRAVSYASARADLAAGQERLWHDGVKNPWYVWQASGTWHQVYYDDEESLSAKYDLALDQELGGVGMWALNHDSGYTELWDLLESKFGAEPATPPGHRANPIPIDAFPFHDEQDTTVGPSRYFNYYSCNPALAEYGREFVYVLDTCQAGTLTASVPEYASQDPDVHLLGALDQDACLARAHLDLTAPVAPGRYYLTVDTYVSSSVELEGPYTLDVDFVPDPGSEPCAAHLVCLEGACACPVAGTTDCGSFCADLLTDAASCGTCGHACDPGQHCDQGGCVSGPGPDAGVDPDGSVTRPDAAAPVDAGDATPPGGGDGGCDCAAGGDGAPAGLLLVLLATLLAIVRRRRR
jgi:MYXO-CTERM domain-containing protein